MMIATPLGAVSTHFGYYYESFYAPGFFTNAETAGSANYAEQRDLWKGMIGSTADLHPGPNDEKGRSMLLMLVTEDTNGNVVVIAKYGQPSTDTPMKWRNAFLAYQDAPAEPPTTWPPRSRSNKTLALVIGGIAVTAATIGGIYFYKRAKKKR